MTCQNDTNYIIILQAMTDSELDALTEYSRDVTIKTSARALRDPYQDSTSISISADAQHSGKEREGSPSLGRIKPPRNNSPTPHSSIPQIVVSPHEDQSGSAEKVREEAGTELYFGFKYSGDPSKRVELTVEIEDLVKNATRDDFAKDNFQESIRVVDAIEAAGAELVAPLVAKALAQRLKEPYSHIQMKCLNLAKVLAYNSSAHVQLQLGSYWFAYRLARMALSKTTTQVVRQAVVDLIVRWLDQDEIFGLLVSPKFLQGALNAILTGTLDGHPELEDLPPESTLLEDFDPPARKVPPPSSIDPRQLYDRLQDVTSSQDPFVDWSGKGRHVDINDISELSLVPERSIFKTRRYKFGTVRWRSYVLTVKSVKLDARWTREDAFREVETLEMMQHSHIIQVVGSYSLPNKFSLLCYPATQWTLEQFLKTPPPDSDPHIARWFACMASAVQHIHSRGLRHGAIRPRLCLVAFTINRQMPFHIHLTGFDLAHRRRLFSDMDDDSPDADPNEAHSDRPSFGGSAAKGKYAAPEMMKEREEDIFSLGCIFVEMMALLSSGSAYQRRLDDILENDTPNQTAYRHKLPSIAQLIQDFSSEAMQIGNDIAWKLTPASECGSPLQLTVERMIKVNPEDRPTAAEVEGVLGTHVCCRAQETEFEPDWLSANRAIKDTGLDEARLKEPSRPGGKSEPL